MAPCRRGKRYSLCGGDSLIFATVGTQLPFPRLFEALSSIARQLDEPILGQTAEDQTWPDLETHRFLSPEKFGDCFQSARVIVAHAGIGTVLSAQRWQKPLIIMPRRFDLGEHRNDHQQATAKQVGSLTGVYVVSNAEELGTLLKVQDLTPASSQSSKGKSDLVDYLRNFISAA